MIIKDNLKIGIKNTRFGVIPNVIINNIIDLAGNTVIASNGDTIIYTDTNNRVGATINVVKDNIKGSVRSTM